MTNEERLKSQEQLNLLAGMLSTHNFQNKHPQIARDWIIINSEELREALKDIPANHPPLANKE